MSINDFINAIKNDKNNVDSSLLCNAFIDFLKYLNNCAEGEGMDIQVVKNAGNLPLDSKFPFYEISGVYIDSLEHDKKKDFEIAKYKNAFESAKCERDETVCKYKKEIEQLENWNKELQEALIEIPNEPIKAADFLIDKFADLERQDIINSKPEYIENVFVQSGEKGMKICKLGEYHLRQIAKHLLIYCGDSEE